MRRPDNLKLKYFLEKMTLCDVWKLLSYVFLWRWRSKGLVVLKFERCEHRDDTSYCRWRSRRCEVLIAFYVERHKWRRCPLGWGIELCGSSSCLGGLRSFLNAEGILMWPMFLMSDGSLIQMWSASFACQCKVLLSLSLLSIIVKSLSSAFSCFVEIWSFLMELVVWFLWSETHSFMDLLVSLMYSAVQLLAGHFSDRLYQFSVHLELDLLGCMSKDLMVLVPLKKTLTLYFARQLTLHTCLISIYNRSVIPMFTPFKLQDN